MQRIFCDLCEKPAKTYYSRTFNHPGGGVEDITVFLEVSYRRVVPHVSMGPAKSSPMGKGHICTECLKELLVPLPVAEEDVGA